MVTKKQVNEVFAKLRKAGYFAKQDFLCCSSCGWAGIERENCDKAVFYHHQDNDSWDKKRKVLNEDLYLAWSGNGDEIVKIIESCGLTAIWDGSEGTRIAISYK